MLDKQGMPSNHNCKARALLYDKVTEYTHFYHPMLVE
jgi:hypothetical protein